MGNFDRNDRGGNRGGGFRGGNGGGRKSFGGGNRGPVTMHKAVCDECHKDCQVPFRPSGDKPIYCSECFGGKKEGGNRNDRGDRKDFGSFKPRRDFEENRSKPFVQNNTGLNIGEDVKKQLSEMNLKLDRLINAIESISVPKSTVAKAPISKVEIVRSVTKASVKKIPVKVLSKKVITKKKK